MGADHGARLMQAAHFYHVWSDGSWRQPVAEHMAALEDAKFDGFFALGVVGSNANRREAINEISHLRKPDFVVHAEEGFEQVTLDAVHRHAQEHDDAILYAHTKGAANVRRFQDQWRWNMTHHVIRGWRNCREALESGHYDAVGCHWLTAEEFPHIKADTGYPMFGGNFWMATAEYVRSLPPVSNETRWHAESWIGLNHPRVLDLFPGWPGSVPFPRHKMRRLTASPTAF